MRDRPLTREQSQSRDHAEIENIEKGGPIAMGEYHVVNATTREELHKQIQGFMDWLRGTYGTR
jgi:hypothetical protein